MATRVFQKISILTHVSTVFSLPPTLGGACAVLWCKKCSFCVSSDALSYTLSHGVARGRTQLTESWWWLIELFLPLCSLQHAKLHHKPYVYGDFGLIPHFLIVLYDLDFCYRSLICFNFILQLKLIIYYIFILVVILLILGLVLISLMFSV